MSLVLSLFLVAFAWIACLALWVFVKDCFHPLRKLPGPPLRDPFFGILSATVLNKGQILDGLQEQLKLYGPVRKCYLFLGEIRVLVSDPRWIKHVLITNAKNYVRGNYAGVEFIRQVHNTIHETVHLPFRWSCIYVI